MLLKYYKIIIIIFLLYIYNCLLFKGGSPCDLTNFSTITNVQLFYAKINKNLNTNLLKYSKLFLLNKLLDNNKIDMTKANTITFNILNNELNTIKNSLLVDFKNKLNIDYYKKKIFGGNIDKCGINRLIKKYLITVNYYQKKFSKNIDNAIAYVKTSIVPFTTITLETFLSTTTITAIQNFNEKLLAFLLPDTFTELKIGEKIKLNQIQKTVNTLNGSSIYCIDDNKVYKSTSSYLE